MRIIQGRRPILAITESEEQYLCDNSTAFCTNCGNLEVCYDAYMPDDDGEWHPVNCSKCDVDALGNLDAAASESLLVFVEDDD